MNYKLEYTRTLISYIILERYIYDIKNIFYSQEGLNSIKLEYLWSETIYIRDFIDLLPAEHISIHLTLSEILHIKDIYSKLFNLYREMLSDDGGFISYLERNRFLILNKL